MSVDTPSDHHDGDGKDGDNLDLQTQASKHPFTPSILKLPLLMPEGNPGWVGVGLGGRVVGPLQMVVNTCPWRGNFAVN